MKTHMLLIGEQIKRQCRRLLDGGLHNIIAAKVGRQAIPILIVTPKDIAQPPVGHTKATQEERFLHLIGIAGHIGQHPTRRNREDRTARWHRGDA